VKSIPFIVNGLLLILLAAYYACKLWGTHLPDFMWILAWPLILYAWFHDWPGLKDSPKSSEQPRIPKKEKIEPPVGYTGPFWNKPSADYLEANAQPYSSEQRIAVWMFLLIPFAVLAYILLH